MESQTSAIDSFVPENIKGKATDLTAKFQSPDREQALKCFKRAHKRLLNVELWHKLCGPLSAEFVLAGKDGGHQQRLAEKGDYFMIDIPGPGTFEGEGYDWVQVLDIADYSNENGEYEAVALKAGACGNPGNQNDETAHFFKEGATSTFIIRRDGNTVTVSYAGRNEVPNTDVERITDKLRNSAVAIGAFGGLSEIQWQALIESFLREEV